VFKNTGGMDMSNSFWDKVRERAYYKYLARKSLNVPDDALQDWDEAFREQIIDDRINEEAYYHYLNGGADPDENWKEAYREINERISFLAFYQHVGNMNRSSMENWVMAQNIYINNF
jgi:hypothetical protein